MAVLLLLWTGADLTNASLCALEQEQDPPAASTRGFTTLDASTMVPSPVAADAVHVDDCFCCSHCVELARLTPEMGSELVSRDLQPLVLPAPRIFGLQLYHPPLV